MSVRKFSNKGIYQYFDELIFTLKWDKLVSWFHTERFMMIRGFIVFKIQNFILIFFSPLLYPKNIWHQRLAHINFGDIWNTYKTVGGVSNISKTGSVYLTFNLRRAQKLPFSGNFSVSKSVGVFMHSYIVGYIDIYSSDGQKDFYTFLYDH